MFARSIRNSSTRPRSPRFATHVDNSTTLLLLHRRQGGLHHANRYRQIDGHDSLPLFLVNRVRATPSIAHARTVDQNINAVVLANALCHRMFSSLGLGKISLVEGECGVVFGELLRLRADVYAEN